MEQLDFEVLVPGHGKIFGKDHVRLFRRLSRKLSVLPSSSMKQGRSLEETKQAVRPEIRAVAALC